MTRWFTAVATFVAWGGILLQLFLSLRLAAGNGKSIGEGLFVFFGYFTILTNILVALALTAALFGPSSWFGRSRIGVFFRRPGVLTSIAAAILLVGLAYFFLLRQTWQPEGLQLVADVVLHYVTPGLFAMYWWLFAPRRELRWRAVGAWLAYPLGFFAYSLIRGELTGQYAYPFIDVGTLGYGRTLLNAVAVLAGFTVICLALVGLGRIGPAASHSGDCPAATRARGS